LRTTDNKGRLKLAVREPIDNRHTLTTSTSRRTHTTSSVSPQ